MSNLLFIDCVVTAAGYGIYGGNSDSVSYKACAAIRCMIFAGQGCYYRTNTVDCISVGGFYGYYTGNHVRSMAYAAYYGFYRR